MNCNLNILKKYNDNNKLTIFVGAGVSKSSHLPSWEDLINKIKTELSISSSETDYLKIAQLYYLSCGETVYYQKIKEFFPENIEPTVIQKLIFDLKPAHIITTNWDILLEKTAQDNGLIYDIISKDEHLVQSELENHIIKMHGDFKYNNIVFKEDDYINYQFNFPLIENYVRSILSTNAILFLGYSYSDINLKQISKWIQNNSKTMPPMFLVVFNEDKNQNRYLENFGIKTIVIKKEDKSFHLDSYSNKLATFLSDLNSEEKSIEDINNMSNNEVIEFLLNRLEPLDNLNAILLNQVKSTLTNCDFLYEPTEHKNLVLLEFYDTLLTSDINKGIRKIYNRFREILFIGKTFNENEEKILKIMSIFKKANVDGIVVTNDNEHSKQYHIFPKILNNKINQTEKQLCNFDFNDLEANDNDINSLMKKTFLFYQKYEFLKAYKLNEKIIKLCLKQQNYLYLFLAMFNQNILLNNLKRYLDNIGVGKEYKTASDAWQYKVKPYNLDEKFYELPKTVQKILHEIKPFINYDYLYRFASVIEDELDKKVKQKKAIEIKSTMTWDSNVTRNYSKQKNLIHFVLNNFIMLERNYEFVTINKKLIKISLIRQMQREYYTLDKMELFSIVKYITYKDLIELIEDFDKFKLNIDTKTLNWLIIKVLPNIVNLFLKDKSILYAHFGNELKNILYILSMEALNKKQLSVVLKEFKNLITNSSRQYSMNLDIYKLINGFIDLQDNIKEKDLVDIIELMIDKIICNKGSIWDYQAIEDNYIWSPFKHLSNQKKSYGNTRLIKKFLDELSEYEIKKKIQLSQGFLYNIYLLSNEEIKEMIKDFILNINCTDIKETDLKDINIHNTQNFDFDSLDNYGLKISFKLFLAIHEFIDIDKIFIDEVNQYPEREKENIYFLGQITGQVRYLVEKMKIKDLEVLLSKLEEAIEQLNKRQKDIQSMRNII